MATFEYRKLFRANVSLKIAYKTIKEPRLEGVGFSRNMGVTGINIIIPHKLAQDTELELQIYFFLDKPAIFAKGKIIWQAECSYIPQSQRKYYSTGIQLDYMSPEDAIVASDFVKDILKREADNQIKKIVDKIEGLDTP